MIRTILSCFRMTWAAPIGLAIALLSQPALAGSHEPVAEVEIVYAQLGLGVNLSTARGKLMFDGQTHEFELGGMGLGGAGITEVKATGKVYGLKKLEDFYGLYGKTNAAAALGTGTTKITMENSNDVVMEIESDNEGLMLAISASGVTVKELKE